MAGFGTAVGGLIDDHVSFSVVVGVSGQGGGFVPAGPAAQVTPIAVGVSVDGERGVYFGYLPSAAFGVQVLPAYGGTVFFQITNAGSLDTLKGPGYMIGGSGGEGPVLGVDWVMGMNNNGPAPSLYQGLQVSFGVGGGMPVEGHALGTYTVGPTTSQPSSNNNSFRGHGAGGSW